MGTWGMGGKYERDESNISESIDALRHGLSLGLRLIDVAELYGEGLTEEIVGHAIEREKREDVYIISKVWKTHLQYDDVLKSADESLRRLKTDYIDLYLVHWPNPEIPLEETMRAMEQLVENKKVRAIGVSNFDIPLLMEATNYLKKTTLVANQIEYNLLHQEAGGEIIPFCKKNNIHVMAHRPFAKGALATDTTEKQGELARKYQRTPNQIALNWIMSQHITAIPMSGNHKHLEENAGALGWQMSQEDVELLRT